MFPGKKELLHTFSQVFFAMGLCFFFTNQQVCLVGHHNPLGSAAVGVRCGWTLAGSALCSALPWNSLKEVNSLAHLFHCKLLSQLEIRLKH